MSEDCPPVLDNGYDTLTVTFKLDKKDAEMYGTDTLSKAIGIVRYLVYNGLMSAYGRVKFCDEEETTAKELSSRKEGGHHVFFGD